MKHSLRILAAFLAGIILPAGRISGFSASAAELPVTNRVAYPIQESLTNMNREELCLCFILLFSLILIITAAIFSIYKHIALKKRGNMTAGSDEGPNTYRILNQEDHCDLTTEWLDDLSCQMILSQTHMIAYEFDLVKRVQRVSPYISEYLAGNYDGRLLSQVMIEDGVIHPGDMAKAIKFKQQVENSQAGEMVLRLKTPAGSYRWHRMIATQYNHGDCGSCIVAGVIEDIETRVDCYEKIHSQAGLDTVSGIYDKTTFFLQTQRRLEEAAGTWYLIRFDVDRFKMINNLFGSDAGDSVLRRIGDILQELAGPEETYGRLGNDVFCMCVRRSRNDTVALVKLIADKLQDYPLAFRFFLPTGIVEIPPQCKEPVDILCDQAAVAQQKIKGSYLQPYMFFEMSMGLKMKRDHELILNMEKALNERQFMAYFQPQYDMRDGRIIGAEALARWQHPTFGMISPAEFIPLFERNGFIVELDRYIWEVACRAIHGWMAQGVEPVPISVNVSRVHLYDEDFCDKIISLCDQYSVPYSLLELEITESAYTEQPQELFPIMEMLQKVGFHFAMDDFGSGYSSLNILKDIPVNIVKFDLRFLEKARKGDQVGQSILKNTIQLMNDLHLSILAEGVETKKQVGFLQTMGCNYAQGFYYARPMPLDDFERLLAGKKTRELDHKATGGTEC